jgi:hypothetical protein
VEYDVPEARSQSGQTIARFRRRRAALYRRNFDMKIAIVCQRFVPPGAACSVLGARTGHVETQVGAPNSARKDRP